MNSLNCHWSQPIIQEWFTGACTLYSALLLFEQAGPKWISLPGIWVFWHSALFLYSLYLFSLFLSPLPSHHLFHPLPPEKQEIWSFPTNEVFLCSRLYGSAPGQANRILLSMNNISTDGQRILRVFYRFRFVSSQCLSAEGDNKNRWLISTSGMAQTRSLNQRGDHCRLLADG